MSIRALWIFGPAKSKPSPGQLTTSEEWQLIYTRRFTIMESRARQFLGDKYIPIPRDDQLIMKSILCQVGLDKKTTETYIENRDSCNILPQMPVIEIQLNDDTRLWPIVVVEHCDYLLCGLPLIENYPNYKNDSIGFLIHLQPVSTVLSVLLAIQTFVGQLASSHKSNVILEQLEKYICVALPFGRPGELEPSLIQSILTIKPVVTDVKQSIIPLPTKVQNVSIKVTEFIRGVQYDNQEIKDVIQVYGSITWTGCLENQQNEVTLSLSSNYGNSDLLPLNFVTLHPCVSQIDQDAPNVSKKFRFKPLTSNLPLCYYVVHAKKFPILGNFKMQFFSNYLTLTLQLTLDEKVRNFFEVCEVFIPLPQKGIGRRDFKPSWGEMLVSKDAKFIVWTLGQQFPSSLQVYANAFVYLTNQISESELKIYSSQAFAKIHFKIPEFTSSGYFVDVKSVQTTFPSSVKMTSKREFCSVEYKIWNKTKDPPIHFNQKLISEPQTPT